METEILFLGLAAFLAATLVPVSSEIVFTGYLALGYSKSARLPNLHFSDYVKILYL